MTSAAVRDALIDDLADWLTGRLEIAYENAPTRIMRGNARVFEADVALPPRWVNIEPRIVVEIECESAAKFDAEPDSRILGTTPVEIPCGTLGHGGLIKVPGSLSAAFSIRYRGISGVLLGELTIDPDLASGEHLIIDFDSQSLTKMTTGGVPSNVYSWITGGRWFNIFPRDGGIRSHNVWGTLEQTGGTGIYYFRRNYQN